MRPDLIFDVGMHKGFDSEYYLRKGFRVVAVEANPLLARGVRERLKDWIQSGRLTICEVGVAADFGLLDFYINGQQDDWSSFVPDFGMRGGAYTIEKIWCAPLASLLDQFGTPYYLKIDIEGHDDISIKALELSQHRPRYVSVEATVPQFGARMDAMGYRSFKLISQRWHPKVAPMQPPLEGEFTDMKTTGLMTGQFGEEAYGGWLDLEAFNQEIECLRAKRFEDMIQHKQFGVPLEFMEQSWWDYHARFGF